MILLPAIDLIGGRCVRLAQGDFARETSYSDDPVAALADFARGDKIDLTGTGVDMTFIGNAAFSGVAGQLRYAGGYLSADTNGDGVADLSVQILGSPSLSGNDLLFI